MTKHDQNKADSVQERRHAMSVMFRLWNNTVNTFRLYEKLKHEVDRIIGSAVISDNFLIMIVICIWCINFQTILAQVCMYVYPKTLMKIAIQKQYFIAGVYWSK